MQKTVQDSLIQMVENNYDEVEFYTELTQAELDRDDDEYIEYNNGYIEIDDDFVKKMNGIGAAVYDSSGNMFYGNDPNPDLLTQTPFKEEIIQVCEDDKGTKWYIYDKSLAAQKLEGFWLRGAVSEKQGQAQLSDTVRFSVYLLPFLVLFAIVGGYIFAGRLLRPINEINAAAMEIGQGQDLSKRIDLGPGKDELHQLADNFNKMIGQLENSFNAEKQFSSDVSHELRTPLSVIRAECEYILEEEREKEEYIEALEAVERQGHHMSKIVEDLLMFTRLERRTEMYTKEDIDFSGLVMSVCEDMSLLQTRGIQLDCSCDDHIHVTGNLGLLVRMLTNLISNSYRYGTDNGYIHVSLHQSQEGPALRIEDNGTGIPEDQLENIFHRFYQIDSSRSGKGTGLGLAMVQEIARYHDAVIRVASQPGLGSTFTVIFQADSQKS